MLCPLGARLNQSLKTFSTAMIDEIVLEIRSFCCIRSIPPYDSVNSITIASTFRFGLFACQMEAGTNEKKEKGFSPYFWEDPGTALRWVVPTCPRCHNCCREAGTVVWWNHKPIQFHSELAFGYYTCSAVRFHSKCAYEWGIDDKQKIGYCKRDRVKHSIHEEQEHGTMLNIPYVDTWSRFLCDEQGCNVHGLEQGKSANSLFALRIKCNNPLSANIFKCTCQSLLECSCGVIQYDDGDNPDEL